MQDDQIYTQLQEAKYSNWENKCLFCGACCGIVEGDPCEHLESCGDKKFKCRIYEKRFGTHKTISGKEFKCVPVREILHKSWPGDSNCPYKKL